MSDSQEFVMSDEVWSANDYSNIITISSAAIASVLLVIFKSRCSNISICFGLFSCNRKVTEDEDKVKTPESTSLPRGEATLRETPKPNPKNIEPEPEPEPEIEP